MASVPSVVPSVTGGSWEDVEGGDITGYPATPRFPGAVEEDHGSSGTLSVNRAGPVEVPGSEFAGDEFSDDYPEPGMVADPGSFPNHTAPEADWDSGDVPFAGGPGGIPSTHSVDDGGTWRNEHVNPPFVGQPYRTTVLGRIMNRIFQFDPVTGQRVSTPGERTNRDEYQGNHYPGYDPAEIDYSERPIHNNLAHTAGPMLDQGSAYVPAQGELTDMSPNYDDKSVIYEAPQDPAAVVNAAQTQQQAETIGAEWMAG